jgi:TATA element modulatory factor
MIPSISHAAIENKARHTLVDGGDDGNSDREILSPPSVVSLIEEEGKNKEEEGGGGGGASTTSALSSPLPPPTAATTTPKVVSTGSDRNMASIIASYESKLKEANNLIATLKRERAAALKAGKNDKNTEATELLLKEKDEIIRQVMEEGEALSKKQLQQETVIKKLRLDVKKFKGEVQGLTDQLTSQQDQNAALTAAQEHHAHQLEVERQQYEGLLKEAQAAAKMAESKASDSVKAGAARCLKDAESKVDSLEANLSQLREELDQERASADEREELLSREVAELQRRCSEAEARLQEAQARLPETAVPLMRQVEAMQTASQQQERMWIEAEAALQAQLTASKEAADALAQERNAAVEQVEHLTQQVEDNSQLAHVAQFQLTQLQQKLDEQMNKVQRLEDELQDTKAELRATRDAGAMLESVYTQQLEAAQAKDQESQNKINSLQQQLNSGQSSSPSSAPVATSDDNNNNNNNNKTLEPPALAGPGMKWVLMRETASPMRGKDNGETEEGLMVAGERLVFNNNNNNNNHADDQQLLLSNGGRGGLTQQLVSFQRRVTDLTSARDRLSEELVKAETSAAAGEASKRKVAQLEKQLQELAVRHSAAVELLGEREESLEELSADLAELKQNFRHQIEFMADELQKYKKGAVVQ